MEKTWASGAIELLRHADSHIDLDSAFDKRIAFISIDNSVETSVRTFLSLPEAKSGVKISRADVEAAGNSFPKLVALLFKHAGSRLSGIDPDDIEHYHRIRNQLYHDGTGFSVDDQYLGAYRSIAAVILQSLFDVAFTKTSDEAARLDALILNWNRIDQNIQARFQAAGIDGHTWKWEEASQRSILTRAQVQELTELRMARNRLVHSTSVDEKDVAYWARKSAGFLALLQEDTRGG